MLTKVRYVYWSLHGCFGKWLYHTKQDVVSVVVPGGGGGGGGHGSGGGHLHPAPAPPMWDCKLNPYYLKINQHIKG